MNEPKSNPVVFDCPRCSQKVSVMLSKANLHAAVTHGIVEVNHAFCNYKGPLALTGTRRGEMVSQAQYAWVTVAPLPHQRENPSRYRMVRADSEGRFTIPSVVPGEYKVFVFDEIAYGAAVNPHFISRFESSGVPVTVKGGETVSVDPQIIPVP